MSYRIEWEIIKCHRRALRVIRSRDSSRTIPDAAEWAWSRTAYVNNEQRILQADKT